jgi:hypothetical protein
MTVRLLSLIFSLALLGIFSVNSTPLASVLFLIVTTIYVKQKCSNNFLSFMVICYGIYLIALNIWSLFILIFRHEFNVSIISLASSSLISFAPIFLYFLPPKLSFQLIRNFLFFYYPRLIVIIFIWIALFYFFGIIESRNSDMILFSGWPTKWSLIPLFYCIFYVVFLISLKASLIWVDHFSFLISVWVIIISETRASLVLMFLYFLFLLIYVLFKNGWRGRLFLLLSLIVLGSVFNLTFLDLFPRISDLLFFLDDTQSAESSLGFRFVAAWPFVFKLLDESGYWMIGWGNIGIHHFSNFLSVGTEFAAVDIISLDSQYIEILHRQGLVGLAFFILLIIITVFRLREKYIYLLISGDSVSDLIVTRALYYYMIAFAIASIFTETLRFLPILILFSISMSIASVQKNKSLVGSN